MEINRTLAVDAKDKIKLHEFDCIYYCIENRAKHGYTSLEWKIKNQSTLDELNKKFSVSKPRCYSKTYTISWKDTIALNAKEYDHIYSKIKNRALHGYYDMRHKIRNPYTLAELRSSFSVVNVNYFSKLYIISWKDSTHDMYIEATKANKKCVDLLLPAIWDRINTGIQRGYNRYDYAFMSCYTVSPTVHDIIKEDITKCGYTVSYDYLTLRCNDQCICCEKGGNNIKNMFIIEL